MARITEGLVFFVRNDLNKSGPFVSVLAPATALQRSYMELVLTWAQRNHEKPHNLKVRVLCKPSLGYVAAYAIDILHNHSFNFI